MNTISSRAGTIGVALAIAALLLTRSATTAASGLAVVAVLALVLLVRRTAPPRRPRLYLAAMAAVVVVAVVAVLARTPLLGALGRSSDLTGRTDIWAAVLDLGAQHPVVGWGWVGYWVPWAAPFTDLAERNGVVYLQAHDAYLDVWMQTGIIGLVLFLLYVVTTLSRSWACATRIGYDAALRPRTFDPVSLLPLLVVVALLVQSVAESRLLYQGNWVLFALIAIKTRIVLTGEEPTSTGDGPRTPPAKREFRWATTR